MHIDVLTDQDTQAVYEHLLRLSPQDRYLRFCTAASDEFIKRYCFTVMKLDYNTSFGAFDEMHRLVGVANIAIIDDKSCELAFSIDEEHRGSGLARKLMKAAIEQCRMMGMKKLCMSCLRENKKMQALADYFGLYMTITYDEAYAELGITK